MVDDPNKLIQDQPNIVQGMGELGDFEELGLEHDLDNVGEDVNVGEGNGEVENDDVDGNVEGNDL
jgi:hypothetical protein